MNKMKLRYEKKMVLFSIIMIIVTTELISGTSATSIRWKNCSDPDFTTITITNINTECGFLSVPLDYGKPHGTQIQLAISRIKHTVSNDKFQGIILIGPDGPGGSGLSLVNAGKRLPKSINETYDWIGFDPRGMGSSKPTISCIPNYFDGPRPNYIPTDQTKENIWLNRSKDYAMACAKNNTKLLAHMTSIDIVKDIESIRIALNQGHINFYGFGYGSYLGQVYATLFPNRVRRMVLDSNANPTRIWFQSNLDQDIGFDRNINLWFNWLAKYDSVYQLGNTACAVAQRWNTVLQELKTNPANGIVGPDEWLDIFLSVVSGYGYWISLGEAFSQWANNKNFSSLVENYQSTDGSDNDNSYAVYLAVICTDTQWPQSWDYVRTANWRTFSKAPISTWYNAWYNGPCQYWPAKASKLVNINGSKVGNILLVGQTLDAFTPFEGNLEVRRRFPGARLIALPGGTRSDSTYRNNTCVDNFLFNYLKSGEVPTRQAGDTYDVECAPPPEPDPSSVG